MLRYISLEPAERELDEWLRLAFGALVQRHVGIQAGQRNRFIPFWRLDTLGDKRRYRQFMHGGDVTHVLATHRTAFRVTGGFGDIAAASQRLHQNRAAVVRRLRCSLGR